LVQIQPPLPVNEIRTGAFAPFLFLRDMRTEELEIAIEPVVTGHGCELWGIELLRGKKRPTIRVFIDAIAGATIDDCEKVAKDLNYELALNDTFFDQDFVLEVSSPGVDRKIFKIEQLSAFLKEDFDLKLREMKDGKRSLVAKLINIDNDEILFQSGEEKMILNFADLDLCRLKPNFEELMRVNK
jgi:ribosome maturation factor RimP